MVMLLAGVFYFSWLPQPQLGAQVPMPGFLSRWVDARVNENFRTAVPFFMMGLLTGAQLKNKACASRTWLSSWVVMMLIACIAELGQCFIPARTCDPRDIGWAAAGGAAGLLIVAIAGRITLSRRKVPAE